MFHYIYYQNKTAKFTSFQDAYTFVLLLKKDCIDYNWRLSK